MWLRTRAVPAAALALCFLVGTSTCPPQAHASTSWGRIKAQYRGESIVVLPDGLEALPAHLGMFPAVAEPASPGSCYCLPGGWAHYTDAVDCALGRQLGYLGFQGVQCKSCIEPGCVPGLPNYCDCLPGNWIQDDGNEVQCGEGYMRLVIHAAGHRCQGCVPIDCRWW